MEIIAKPEDIAVVLSAVAAEADALGRSELKRLSANSAAERGALANEYSRLKTKYGDRSPQAAAAAASLDWLDQERAAVEAQLIRESTPAPATANDHFTVYGRVFDSKGTGVPGMDVAAISSKGPVGASAKTVENGAFELVIKLPTAGKAGAEAATTAAIPAFQVKVSSRKPRVSYLDDEVFEPAPDRMAYRELVVPDFDVSQIENQGA